MSERAGDTRGAWIVSPAWDAVFMFSGLWLLPIVWLLDDVSGVYLVLTLAFWIGHRVSSTYLAYFTSLYRPLLTTQRTRFVWVPLALVVVVLAILVPGDDVWPWPRTERIVAVLVVDYVWNAYHFAAQHFGVLSLYRARALQHGARSGAHDPRARTFDRAFALGVGGALVVGAEVLAGTVFFARAWSNVIVDGTPARAVGTGIVLAAALAVLVLDRAHMTTPRALYVVSIALLVATAFWLTPLAFIAVWTVQHWTAAVGLALVAARGDPAPTQADGATQERASRWYRAWHVVSARPLALLALLVVVSAALFPFMELQTASDAADTDLAGGAGAFAGVIDVLASSPLAPLVIAVGFASAFLHYHLDRAVYRFSDPAVRRAASALLERPR